MRLKQLRFSEYLIFHSTGFVAIDQKMLMISIKRPEWPLIADQMQQTEAKTDKG